MMYVIKRALQKSWPVVGFGAKPPGLDRGVVVSRLVVVGAWFGIARVLILLLGYT